MAEATVPAKSVGWEMGSADIVLGERMKLFGYALDHFESGLMFFYFGSTDQVGNWTAWTRCCASR